MSTGPPAPADRQRGNGHIGPAASSLGGDPVEARRARLSAFWALVLRRFRDHADRCTSPPAGGAPDEEDR
jgi:hypothetical protein